MKRYNLQALGNVETFLEKIPRKKKSLVVNLIISNALKSNKINEVLTAFFTDEEIKELFGDKSNKKESVKKGKSISSQEEKNSPTENKEEDSTFKVEI